MRVTRRFWQALAPRDVLGVFGALAIAAIILFWVHLPDPGAWCLTLAAAIPCGWIAATPSRPPLVRFWLILLVLGVSCAALLQLLYTEDRYELSLPYGILTSAEEPTPPNACDAGLGRTPKVQLGPNTILIDRHPQEILAFYNDKVISIDRVDDQLTVSMSIYDPSGAKIVSIQNNKFRIAANDILSFTRKDFHSLTITDEKDRVVADIRIVNENFIEISGLMIYTQNPSMIAKLQTYLGKSRGDFRGCFGGIAFSFDGTIQNL